MTTNMERKKTWPSAMILVLLAIGIIALIALAVYILLMPGALEAALTAGIVIVVAIVAIILIIYAVMAIIAIPMYAYKGEQYQKDTSYDLDGVKSIKEKDSEKDEEE
ncbi:MAG TPA: hypothetical protein VJX93_04460 [Candidatus Methanomethylophilaceae archaeon]|nr:hypothetical protein [Candidatus Methanomethylophilaceae archaeon]